MGQFIEIIEPDEVVDYRFRDEETGEVSQSVVKVRVLADDRVREIEKRHTERVFNKKTRSYEDKLKTGPYIDDVLDAAVVDWADVFNKRGGQLLPCERRYKLAMPERIKTEIVRIAVGKEADGATSTVVEDAKKP